MNFDAFYSFSFAENPKQRVREVREQSTSSSSNGDSPLYGWGKAADKLKMTTTSTTSGHWSLWTLRDSTLLEKCDRRTNGPNRVWNWVGDTKSTFLQKVYSSTLRVCSDFSNVTLPADALVVKGRPSRVFKSNEILRYGETFVYSAISDTVTIQGFEVGFTRNGKRENKMTSSDVILRASGGLAQILAACIKTEDIFIIFGRSLVPGKSNGAEVVLNSSRSQEQDEPPLTLIRLAFDIFDKNIRLVERIRHHKWPGYFDFKYGCVDIRRGYSIEVNRFRTFTLTDGPQQVYHHEDNTGDTFHTAANFEMPITRTVLVPPIYFCLLSSQHEHDLGHGISQRRRSSTPSSSPAQSSGYSTTSAVSSPGNLELSPCEPDFPEDQVIRPNRFRIFRPPSWDDEHDRYSKPKSRVKGHRESLGIWITLLKIFFCIICPFLAAILFVKYFNPVLPNCVYPPGVPTVGVTPAPPSMDQYSSYNNYNYDDDATYEDTVLSSSEYK